MIRLVLRREDADAIEAALDSSGSTEHGCFCLLRAGDGTADVRLVALEPMMPPADAWDDQGADRLRPSARWISACVSRAVTERAGLLFVHSHPDVGHPIGLSWTDRSATLSLAATIGSVLEGPFAAVAVHPEGWAGSLVVDGGLEPIARIHSIGRTLVSLSPVPGAAPDPSGMDARQADALGRAHGQLRQLSVAVVGAGGLGSPIAEQLVRMGVRQVILVDRDRLDTPSNVRRIFGSTLADLHAAAPPPKVDVVGRHLDTLMLGSRITRVDGDVRDASTRPALLDADVIICGTDTHGSRAALNDVAAEFFLPLIDVGVRAAAKASGELAALVAEIRIVTPATPCLWCRKTISGDVIRAENLPPDQQRTLAAEGYLPGQTGAPAPSVVALTVLGAGLATCALLALLSAEADVAPSGYWVDGFLGDSLDLGLQEPLPGCRCRQRLGLAGIDLKEPAAERDMEAPEPRSGLPLDEGGSSRRAT
jgi:molybdopterin/thiamine biosynthesis adenylyltransferase